MDKISTLVIDNIYSNLPVQDLYSCGMVNKKFNRVFNNNKLWKNLFNKDYDESIYNILSKTYNTQDYKILVRKCMDLQRCARDSKFSEKIFDDKLVELLLLEQHITFHKNVPCGIDSMICLKSLGIDMKNGCVSDKIMEKIGGVTRLVDLCISNCDFINLKFKKLSKLKNLRRMGLNKCNIKEIDNNINILSNLECLDLRTNNISDISPISNLPKLQYLTISHNNISGLHYRIFKLENLKELDLSHNKIKYIPREIRYLFNLNNLNLSYNEFDEFPVELYSLASLTILLISNNRIKSIPDEIGYLNLSYMDLSSNNLENIESLASLHDIDVNVENNVNLRNYITLPPSVQIHW